ncbi:MAG TPA: hypothetical protein VK797_23070 [Tepidisphaeraceae bacterium]|nr:hypothetical protein [Tepidisphaeraceae bacterium]
MHPLFKSALVAFGCNPAASDEQALRFFDRLPLEAKNAVDARFDQLIWDSAISLDRNMPLRDFHPDPAPAAVVTDDLGTFSTGMEAFYKPALGVPFDSLRPQDLHAINSIAAQIEGFGRHKQSYTLEPTRWARFKGRFYFGPLPNGQPRLWPASTMFWSVVVVMNALRFHMGYAWASQNQYRIPALTALMVAWLILFRAQLRYRRWQKQQSEHLKMQLT